MNPDRLRGKKVSVIGAGKSGIAAAELLLRAACAVPFVSEHGTMTEPAMERLQASGIAFEQGGHTSRVYDADLCIVSPGIAPSAPVLQSMKDRGIALFGEIELASWFCRSRIIAITGTDGKTTTTTLVHRICEADGKTRGYRAFCVGNIGVPFSSLVQEMAGHDVAVVELSSYQLERCMTFRPLVSLLTNITPDHLARYGGDMDAYARAKFRIYANQKAGDSLMYNDDDPVLRRHFSDAGMFPFRIIPFGRHAGRALEAGGGGDAVFPDGEMIVSLSGGRRQEVIRTGDFMKRSFRGEHNLSNVLAAVAASCAAGIPVEVIRSVLTEFPGVEHRQEFVGTARGLDWVNDSKATNVNAMKQALQATPGKLLLIAGGRDKGNDYRQVSQLVVDKAVCVIAIGESKQNIVRAFEGLVPVFEAESLGDAVLRAASFGSVGETVLFSPGCASFDMFDNFEQRGKAFKQFVGELTAC